MDKNSYLIVINFDNLTFLKELVLIIEKIIIEIHYHAFFDKEI